MAETLIAKTGPGRRYCCFELLALCLLKSGWITDYALHASRMDQHDHEAQRCRAYVMGMGAAEALTAKPGPGRRCCCSCVLVPFLPKLLQITKYAPHASKVNQYNHEAQRCTANAMLSEMATALTAKPGLGRRYCSTCVLIPFLLKLPQIT